MAFASLIRQTGIVFFSLAIMCAVFAPSSPAGATEAALETSQPEKLPEKHPENWFFYLSAGFGSTSHDQNIQDRIDFQKNRGASGPFPGSFDLPGVYRRAGNSWALGFVFNMIFETASKSFKDPDSYSVQLLNPSLSALYFPGGSIGLGWFGRVDLGYSRLMQLRTGFDIPDFYDRHHDDGAIAQLGAGYGWQAASVSRLLAHINGFYASAAAQHVAGVMLHVGFLF